MTSLTGVNVIQYYQSEPFCSNFRSPPSNADVGQAILYKSLGINSHMILALAGIYGTCAFVSNVITTRYVLDAWGRRPCVVREPDGIKIAPIQTYTDFAFAA